MLYSKIAFDRHMVPRMDFPRYFEMNYNSLPSFHELVSSGGFKNCCGGDFVQNESGVFQADFFGAVRDMNIVEWSSKNFKGETRICASAVFEILPGGIHYLWNIAFTTCDPFFFDNFTQPLGLDMEATRATFSKDTGAIMIHNELPPVEYRVFFVDKIRFSKQRLDCRIMESSTELDNLRNLAMTSRNMDRTFLRQILERYALHVPTAEICRDRISSLGVVCTAQEFEDLKIDELAVLRGVVKTLTSLQFYNMYISCLDGLLDYPINLLPEEYKKFGRRLLMTKEDCEEWDKLVFLLMLGERAKLIVDSPFDASLGLGSGSRAFCEVSHDDERFAEKTPQDPADPTRKIKLGDVGPNWLLRTTETVVIKQEAYIEELRTLLLVENYDAALEHLTSRTATPRNGQGLLGLSIALLRALTLGVIVFTTPMEVAIRNIFAKYNIVWSLPLLSVPINPGDAGFDGVNMLLKLGAPVRDLDAA